MSRSLLMKVLTDYYGLSRETEIHTEERGRRYIDQRYGISFSITHTENFWFCSVSGRESGIDVELLSRYVSDPERLAGRFLTEQEKEYVLSGADRNQIRERLIFLWTRKEAYLKCTGEGLYGLNRAPSVVGTPEGMDLFTCFQEGFCFSVCTPCDTISEMPQCICLDQ